MPLFVNRTIIAGNLTRDPEVKFLANEKAVASFGLAINRRFKGADGEQKDEATFIDVECWGRTAELAGQYLTKGRNVYIEGRIKQESWEDKQTGSKRSKLKIVADQINFIGGKDDQPGRPAAHDSAREQTSRGPDVPVPADLGDDEPPF